MAFKAYSRKSSAEIGAHRIGLDKSAVVKNDDGQWGFYLPRGASALPKLGGGQSGGGSSSEVVEAIKQQTLAIDYAIASSATQVVDKLGGLLTDIRDLLASQISMNTAAKSAAQLRQLEDDREKGRDKSKSSGSFLPSIRQAASGLLDILKMLSVPFILGALTELDKFFDIIGKAKKKFSEWGGKFQTFLDDVAELPMFKDNILGTAIRNLIPILGAVGLFALWKPGATVKGLKSLWSLFSWIGKNPSIAGEAGAASKVGLLGGASRLVGKIAIPITLVTSVFEAIKGGIDGWTKDGAFGAFKGVVDGLVHGLIGGVIDTLSQGVGWILDQFGIDSERFKAFSFAKFLEELGSNLGIFLFDVVDRVKEMFGQLTEGFKQIWSSDNSLFDKIVEMVTWPFKYLYTTFKKEFAGLSTIDMLKKIMHFATGNGSFTKALDTASKPASQKAAEKDAEVKQWPTVQAAIHPQQSITGLVTGTSSDRLEAEAKKAGLSDEQIAYTYETDRLIGAPKGASLAQLKQESGFKNDARSPTGAVGISQFTNVGVDDVLFGRAAKTDEEKAQRAAAKQSLVGNTDKGLEYQRSLLQKIQKRSGDNWQQVMRNYNGDVSVEKNGMEARDNYIARIKGYLTADGVNAVPKKNSGAALQATTEQVNDAKQKSSSAAPVIAPINASRTNVNNSTAPSGGPSITAATPAEFAPWVA